READHHDAMAGAPSHVPQGVVPRGICTHTARRVITLERREALHLDAFVAANPDPAPREDAARKLSDTLWRMQVEIGLMHADPHPGNYMFLPDGRIGLLDFGCVKVFPESFTRNYVRLLRAILRRNDEQILDVYEDMGFLQKAERG